MVILDDQTSDICRALAAQDKIYPLSDALEVMDNLMVLENKFNSLDDARDRSKLSDECHLSGADVFTAYTQINKVKST
ncbi:MAG TPA: hypothetical protein PLK65_01170 [Candidatus Cloacimonas sp.]|nr:hypothetical protein [Candidatus Cloacimonas sp.]